MNNRIPFYVSSLLLLLLTAAEFAAILRMNNGMFVYTLDDAYIHLSLAENIALGHYGINPGEFASVASSILWPFLLAPFALFSFGTYIPFVLNIIFEIATLYVLWNIFDRVFTNMKQKELFISVLLVLLIPAAGMVGLIFTGMEHSLQVLAVITILYSIIKELYGEFDPWLTVASIIIASIVRYEDLSVSLFAIAFLFVRGRKTAALVSLGSVIILLSSFSLFLYLNEGSFLPTSVVAKLGSFRNPVAPLSQFVAAIHTSFGMLYGMLALILVLIAIINRKDFSAIALCAGGVFITLLHLAYGKVQYFGNLSVEFGYFFRYEMYLWTILLVILIILAKNIFIRMYLYSRILFIVLLIVAEIVLCGRNNAILSSISNGSNNIFEQQLQIHTFVTHFYQKPVAVNDIGYVSYKNSNYVLDLWGLTSKNILRMRKSNPGNNEWMDSLVTEKNISLVIIYDVWFTNHPAHWKKVAELTLTKPNITASENVVSFYAVNNTEETIQKIRAFRNEMPFKEMLHILQ
ncbi:MAG: hypothetical protein WCI84_02700 [Bacteroidota bacterium]